MDLAGEILKKRREDLGRDIKEIADLLKIRTDYLKAIEEDAFEKLPAPVYTNGYIRCYARYLGVDADPVVEYYASKLATPPHSTIIPVAFFRKKNSKTIYAVFVLLIIAAVLLFVNYPRLMPPDKSVGVPVTTHPAEAARTVTPAVPGKGGEVVPSTHRLHLYASEKSWVRLKFDNGKVEEVLLNPGEARDWRFSGRISLKMGNAGGLQITLDGVSLGSAGGRGQVMTLALPLE
jgi:cytoskeletal protein RodZ